MKYSYFPGCTLHQQAEEFDRSTRESARLLDIELAEIEDWQCCGAVFPLASDAVINLVSPFRTLASAHEAGVDLMTLCSGCLNVLRRTNRLIAEDEEIRSKLIDFVEMEYRGERSVYHLLEVIRSEVTFDDVRSRVKRTLDGLQVASYYGCLLLRPAEVMQFDDVENPRILEDLFEALGAASTDYPFRTECCGSYLSVGRADVTTGAAARIVRSIARTSADVIVTSCPMCHFNLKRHIQAASQMDPGAADIPVIYFTQLVAYALGADHADCGFDPEFVRQLSDTKIPMSEVN